MFEILYTHDDFIIVNKHSGVSVHKDDGDIMLLQEIAKESGDKQLYLVHRLDKMTSGLLIVARNSNAAAVFGHLFQEHAIDKFYLAISDKKPKKKQGLISGDMSRSRRSSWKLGKTQTNPAQTQFFSVTTSPGCRLFLCRPLTGKTHQIRVALKSIGSAIVGDPIYNSASHADRGYLHAYFLAFEFNGSPFKFCCRPDSSTEGEYWSSAGIEAKLTNDWADPTSLPWPAPKK
ncbi:TIGR01621 family pseudouridine synthase [Vibrio sp.]|nr:TIGR01621 family pseudouridine synthase [Vibrio sp.]